MTTKKIWDLWELQAIKYLKQKWYDIVETNFRFSKVWEIDIVAKIWEITVFVEVKYRKNDRFWYWEESITYAKRQKLRKTINYYVMVKKLDYEKIRFDVISILGDKISHYEGVEL